MIHSRANAGFTLIEFLVSVAIMMVLLAGIGVGMDTGSKVYRDASFETDSAMLADTLNNSLGDILRYSQNVRENDGIFQDSLGNNLNIYQAPFVFTNLEYGVQDGYLVVSSENGGNVFEIRNLRNSDVMELVNTGAYPNLTVTDFTLAYVSPERDSGGDTGYAEISYVIRNVNNPSLNKQINMVIRFMN